MAGRFDSNLWLFVVATILMGFLELFSHSILGFAYLMSAGLVYCCGHRGTPLCLFVELTTYRW